MAGLPHQRRAAGLRDLVEQHLARLDVGDDGGARDACFSTSRASSDHELVAPQDAALAVDRRRCGRRRRRRRCRGRSPPCVTSACSCSRFSGTVGSGWCAGKVPSTFSFRMKCVAGQLVDHGADRHADRAVAGVPGDLELAAGLRRPAAGARHSRRAPASSRPLPCAGLEVALGGDLAQLLDVGAEERLLAHHHLEAVVVGRIVRAGDLDAAVGVEVLDREIEHRRRPPGRSRPRRCRPRSAPRRRPLASSGELSRPS